MYLVSLKLVLIRLLDVVGDNMPLQDAFLLADDVLRQVTSPVQMLSVCTLW